MLRATRVLYGGFDNWQVKGVRDLRQGVPAGGLTVEVVILNTDNNQVLRLEGVWDGVLWVDRILSQDIDRDRTDAAKKKGKGRAKPKCTKGRPCGGSCVRMKTASGKDTQCRNKPEGAVKEALVRASRGASGGGSAGGGGAPAVIPPLAEIKAMRQVGEGYFGAVAVSPDGKTAYKYMKDDAGGQINKIDANEIKNLKVASDAGVGPKFLGANKDRTVVAMEFLDGYKRLADPSLESLPKKDQKTVARNLVNVANRMHEANMTHHDFHTGNILFNPSDLSVRIVDFGLAKVSPTIRGNASKDFETLAFFAKMDDLPILSGDKFQDVVTAGPQPGRKLHEDLLRAINATR